MFFGCYGGEGVRVEDGGDDDMGELREDEIVWGEDMHHNETVMRYKGNDGHDAHRSMLSVQIEEEYARWSGGIISNSKVDNGPIQKRTHQRANGEEELGDIEEEEKEEGGITGLPPHELLAREYAATTTFSVLQGAGRTLKGMDLCRLRNKVWRQTGFAD